MTVQTTKISWKWNYFVEVTNDKARCIICNESFRFGQNLQPTRNHLITNHINNDQKVSSQLSSRGWRSQFTTQNDGMKCKLCDQICPISKYIKLKMTDHLKTTHKISENKVTRIIKYKYNKTCDKNRKIIHICNKCNYTPPDNSSFILIKHLIDNHQTDLPANMRPRRLCVLSSPLNYDEEAGITTSNNSQQPNVYNFDANRLSELNSSSNCDGKTPTSINYQQPNVYSLDSNRLYELSSLSNYGEAGIATSINYQQPNQLCVLSSPLNYNGEAGIAASINYQQPIQLCEISNPSNYDGEAGIVTPINYQQPIQLCVLNNPLYYNGEAGIAASINYQQPIQLCVLSSPLNYNGEADIATSSNYQEPIVYSLNSDRSNDLPNFVDVSDDGTQEFINHNI